MTLYQMSFVYREDALRFRMRITVLREQAKAAPTKEERERLKRRILELQQLQRQSRELLRLRYEENMTVTEIAAAIGRDKSTVSRTLSRARRRLYKCLRYGL